MKSDEPSHTPTEETSEPRLISVYEGTYSPLPEYLPPGTYLTKTVDSVYDGPQEWDGKEWSTWDYPTHILTCNGKPVRLIDSD